MKNSTESTGEPYDVVIDGDGYLEPYEDLKQPNDIAKQSNEKPARQCVYYLIFIGLLLLIVALVLGIICEFNKIMDFGHF